MVSTLSWIDYDSTAQQRAQRILTLFREKDTRDELGFGPIRDAISDTLFPGTSIIHTRLRYMLFIPWMYRTLEEKHMPSARMGVAGRSEQLRLAQCLKENCPTETGIIGGDVGDRLKTLPSAIYWAGLGRWSLRLFPGTEGQYQRAVDSIYRRRHKRVASLAAAAEDGDDVGGLWEHGAHTFHPGLPPVPDDFPEGATFRLTREEAHYLQERVRQACPSSLLTDLLANPETVPIEAPWEHPQLASFRGEQRELLLHGRMFSLVAQGAAILYNLMLTELVDEAEKIDEIRQAGQEWLDQLARTMGELSAWAGDLNRFWAAVKDRGHDIHPRAETFVEHWVGAVLRHRGQVFEAQESRDLVQNREIEKKRANSRFTNARVRDQWGGRSGMNRMVYRWPLVRSYVADMAEAMK